jgi:hypothetical protein
MSAFSESDSAVKQWQEQAVISLSSTASSIGALAVNDNLTNYTPSDYELGFLHLYLGLNFLQKNDLDGALVEMRRANRVQEQAKQAREKELKSAEKDFNAQGYSANLGAVLARYPDAGESLQAIQNGYLLFLSGLLFETEGDVNAAYIDLKRALAVNPNNQAVIDSTFRVAKKLGMSEDLKQLRQKYSEPAALAKQQARLIVIDEQGVVDALKSWRLSIPVYDSNNNVGYYSVALPHYPQQAVESFSSLQIAGDELSQDRLVNVNLMAQKQLSEKMPTLLIRQTLRVVAKDQLRKEATNGDELGNLLFNVMNTLTEQPDTRSWQTLPANVYGSITVLEEGAHDLKFGGHSYPITLKQGETTLIWLSRQNDNYAAWHKRLGKL